MLQIVNLDSICWPSDSGRMNATVKQTEKNTTFSIESGVFSFCSIIKDGVAGNYENNTITFSRGRCFLHKDPLTAIAGAFNLDRTPCTFSRGAGILNRVAFIEDDESCTFNWGPCTEGKETRTFHISRVPKAVDRVLSIPPVYRGQWTVYFPLGTVYFPYLPCTEDNGPCTFHISRVPRTMDRVLFIGNRVPKTMDRVLSISPAYRRQWTVYFPYLPCTEDSGPCTFHISRVPKTVDRVLSISPANRRQWTVYFPQRTEFR